ncbi:MAG: hypothetical protein Ct9H300mP1_12790 [Planctomycetaceae bacterium]|nr:MAG: hypothetical protein Ct9H300mP1_12790 [Planctomycetaceae bacterium]
MFSTVFAPRPRPGWGSPLACAQCHDHKYDPFSQQDFYRFFAYFNSVTDKGVENRAGNVDPLIQVVPLDQKSVEQKLATAIKELERQRLARVAEAGPLVAQMGEGTSQRVEEGGGGSDRRSGGALSTGRGSRTGDFRGRVTEGVPGGAGTVDLGQTGRRPATGWQDLRVAGRHCRVRPHRLVFLRRLGAGCQYRSDRLAEGTTRQTTAAGTCTCRVATSRST